MRAGSGDQLKLWLRVGPGRPLRGPRYLGRLGGQVARVHQDARATGRGTAVAEQKEDAVDDVLNLCRRTDQSRLLLAWLLANNPGSLTHCAQLTCEPPQWVALLELLGKLRICRDFLAHVSQHHSGIYGVHPDLGSEATAGGTAEEPALPARLGRDSPQDKPGELLTLSR